MKLLSISLRCLLCAIAILLSCTIKAQDYVMQDFTDKVTKEKAPAEDKVYAAFPDKATWDYTSFGIGIGLDFGGIGINLTQYLGETLGVFGGIGYNLDKVGYNLGTKLRLHKMFNCKKSAPFLLAMYGYNAVAIIQDRAGDMGPKKTFYGPTYGIGFDYRSTTSSTNYWTFSFLIPVRDSGIKEFFDDHQASETYSVPFAISIGYRFGSD